jgi:hypothetical protein
LSPTARVLIVDRSRESRDLLSALPDGAHDNEDGAEKLAAAAARNACPIVVLGTFRRSASPFSAGQFVAKPYHYGALIRRIEELLSVRQ